MSARNRRGLRRAALPLLLAVCAWSAGRGAATPPSPSPSPPEAGETISLSSDLRLRVRDGREIEMEVLPGKGEGYRSIAVRMTGSADLAGAIASWNHDVPPRPGTYVRIPLALLSNEYRALALRSLFPRDHRDGDDWIHVARSGRLATYNEGLWQVAQWFTGDGSRFGDLQRVNRLSSPELAARREVRIPARLLHPALRRRPTSDDGSLEYGEDARGRYAGYRLKPGEALYSAVVVRFTGRTAAGDVNAVARRVAERSGIRDLTDIPAGFLIKIPLELLEPEYLPAGHPRRQRAEAARREMAAELARTPPVKTVGSLKGVIVILDPGHGGRDLGAAGNGIWEHDYVYDVTCRLAARLRAETAATVRLTLEDRETGCVPSRTDGLKANLQGTVGTHPPYRAREKGEAAKAVNLRWYLANSIYRKAVRGGTPSSRVVFLSVHADARHPSLRGVMVYVPGARYRAGTHGRNSAFYRRFREVREKPKVRFSRKQRIRSEAVSRRLAQAIVGSFRARGLPVQSYKPVRNRVIRGRRIWLPAVLRGNQVPAKVLVETVNLSNRRDAHLLAGVRGRQQLADALFEALFAYFGEKVPRTPPSGKPSR